MKLSKYRKALAALGAFLAILSSVLTDGVIAPDEYEVVAEGALSVFLVWLFKNRTPTQPV